MDHDPLGLYHLRRRKLASPDLDFPCVRLSALQTESRGPSLHQRSAALRQRRAAVFVIGRSDAADVALADRCRDLCRASAQCGIGGVGRRAQERPQHALPAARILGLPTLCVNAEHCEICHGFFSVRLRAYGQAASHHASLSSLALGLLASATIAIRFAAVGRGRKPYSFARLADARESSAARALGRQRRRNSCRTASWWRGPHDHRVSRHGTDRKRDRRVLRLCWKTTLAAPSGAHVPASRRFPARVANLGRRTIRDRSQRACLALSREALPGRRLVLVSGSARPDDRPRPGGTAGHR